MGRELELGMHGEAWWSVSAWGPSAEGARIRRSCRAVGVGLGEGEVATLGGGEGRLAEEERLELVSSGEMVAWRCRSATASSSDGIGEGVGVGDGTDEG